MNGFARGALIAAVCACLVVPDAARAQVFPSKTVRIVIGFAPGGLSDTLARGAAQELTRLWGQSVVVENRPGAGDVIATDIVAKAAPDGHTLLQTNHVTWLTNKFLRRSLPYDPARDFVPVVAIAMGSGSVLIARQSIPASNIQEFIAWARSQRVGLNFGSFGIGSPSHLDALALNSLAGITAQHIPYKGGADAVRAVVSGEVEYAFVALLVAEPLVRAGKIKGLAYGSQRRAPQMPQMPTLAEAGYDIETGAWFAWFAPAATPAAVIRRISSDARRVAGGAAFRDKYIIPSNLGEMNLESEALAAKLKEAEEQFAARYKGLDVKLD